MPAWVAPALVIFSLVVPTIGCSMCASPYDYCGPTMTGDAACGGCSSCMATGRAGSILAPGGPVAYAAGDVRRRDVGDGARADSPTPDAEMVGPVLILDKPVEMATMGGPQLPSVSSSRQLH